MLPVRLEFTVMNWTTGQAIGHWYPSIEAALAAIDERYAPGDCYTIWEAERTADDHGYRRAVLDGHCRPRAAVRG